MDANDSAVTGGADGGETAVPARELTAREAVTTQCTACQAIMPAGLVACGECGKPLPVVASLPEAETSAASPVPDRPASGDASPAGGAEDSNSGDLAELLGALPTPENAPAAADRLAPERRGLGRGARRVLLVAVGAVALCTIVGVVWSASASSTTPPAPRPSTTAVATEAGNVTLPGWSTSPAWSVKGIDTAAAFGEHVIGLTGSTATVWDAGTGKKVDAADLAGTGSRVLAGDVDKDAALAAVSDSQALVWVDGQSAPLVLDLTGGRALETRSGSFFVTGPDRTFWLVTKTGEVPLTAPGEQLIVLGGGSDQVMWATGAGHVITASPNGTVLTDATLAAPAAGASVTPKTGWLRASTATVTVVGWTLPDGQNLTGIHDTKTGALIGSVPGAGKGLLAPGRLEWVTDGQRISLVDGKTAPLPAGFIPASYLGGDLLGAQATGGDALLPARETSPQPATGSTVHAIAVTGQERLLVTLTAGHLAVYPTKH